MGAGHDRLTDEGKKFFREIAELQKLQVRVGFQDDNEYEDGTSVIDVAMWNELGTKNSPSRPFMRNSVDDNKEVIGAFLGAEAKKLTNGASAKTILQEIGSMQKGLIQDKIINSKDWAIPNTPSTIKRKTVNGKKGDQPLVDTAHMLQSVNFIIKEKDK